MASSVEEYGLFINGKWATPPGASRFETINPTNREPVGSFVAASVADVGRAIDAAQKAFPAWRDLPAPRRGQILRDAARLLTERKAAIGRIVTREMGKVLPEGTRGTAGGDRLRRVHGREGRRLLGETVPSNFDR
ncbi:Aldehyde dehydrogenase domain protein, partial [mine drainage metagenome]